MTPFSSDEKVIESIRKEFDSIDAYLQTIDQVLQDGRMPDVSGLDDRIAQLCSRIEKAPAEIQGVCLKQLDKLLNKLDHCEAAMTTLHKASAIG